MKSSFFLSHTLILIDVFRWTFKLKLTNTLRKFILFAWPRKLCIAIKPDQQTINNGKNLIKSTILSCTIKKNVEFQVFCFSWFNRNAFAQMRNLSLRYTHFSSFFLPQWLFLFFSSPLLNTYTNAYGNDIIITLRHWELCQMASQSANNYSGCQPNGLCFNFLLHALCFFSFSNMYVQFNVCVSPHSAVWSTTTTTTKHHVSSNSLHDSSRKFNQNEFFFTSILFCSGKKMCE